MHRNLARAWPPSLRLLARRSPSTSVSTTNLPRKSRSYPSANRDRYAAIHDFFTRHVAPSIQPSPMSNQARPATPHISPLVVRAFHSNPTRCSEPDHHNPKSNTQNPGSAAARPTAHTAEPPPPPEPPEPLQAHYENYPAFFRRLALSLPHINRRPTREDFLNVTNGFWDRLRVRFRYMTIRSFRKWNADDISAFVTWFVMSQALWVFVGTTSFIAFILATANSLRMQESIGRVISDYLTHEAGVTIIFESAIVPKWNPASISFKNVYISRRPKSDAILLPSETRMARARHRVAAGYDVANHPSYLTLPEDEEETISFSLDEDTNYTMFDLNVDSIDVTLSLRRWLDGKGLVQDAVIRGVRGVLDRRNVHWDPDNPWNPADYRHSSYPGDFELESLKLEDVLLTVYQPGDFRPYTTSIFRADMGLFRKQWMFYDFLAADNVVGQFDNCLFSLHKPQSIGRTMDQDLRDGTWTRMARFRIDGVNVDHIQAMTTQEGPISWITSGKVDAVFDIKFPREQDDHIIEALLGDLADAITSAASSQAALLSEMGITDRIPGQKLLTKSALHAPEDRERHTFPTLATPEEAAPPVISVDIDLRFRDLKAAVPLFTRDLSYVNNALIRPIVAFINANRTLVPIRCHVIKNLDEFDGAWTMWETGLSDAIALKVYDALAFHVTQANMNQRIKTVSLWSLQMTANAIMSTMRSMVDPLSATLLRDLYHDLSPFA